MSRMIKGERCTKKRRARTPASPGD